MHSLFTVLSSGCYNLRLVPHGYFYLSFLNYPVFTTQYIHGVMSGSNVTNALWFLCIYTTASIICILNDGHSLLAVK